MSIEIQLRFTGNDPGAVRHGNFINYYSFHSTNERIDSLHLNMFPTLLSKQPVICLDIGCNTGELTKEFYQYLQSAVYPNTCFKILGVDIDPSLIQRAIQLNDNPNISYISLDITSQKGQEKITEYLISNQREKFDIIFCFSVTMWIHINSGDDELQNFLKYIKSLTTTLIIEPQPWTCYRNAQRRIKKNGGDFPHYKDLKMRSNIVEEIEHCILLGNDAIKVYESRTATWDRKIQSFHITPNLMS